MATRYVSPVSGTWAAKGSSPFKARRKASRKSGKPYRQHSGNDLQAKNGSPAVAMIGGKVIYAGHKSGYQWNAVVLGDDGNAYRYATHGPLAVKYGDRVDQGQKVGTIGRGHLHLEIIPAGSSLIQQQMQAGNVFVPTQWYPGEEAPTIDPAAFLGVQLGAKITAGKPVGDASKMAFVPEEGPPGGYQALLGDYVPTREVFDAVMQGNPPPSIDASLQAADLRKDRAAHTDDTPPVQTVLEQQSDAAPLDRKQVAYVQAILAGQGYDVGKTPEGEPIIDGIVGDKTREAVAAFRRDKNIGGDGLNRDFARAMLLNIPQPTAEQLNRPQDYIDDPRAGREALPQQRPPGGAMSPPIPRQRPTTAMNRPEDYIRDPTAGREVVPEPWRLGPMNPPAPQPNPRRPSRIPERPRLNPRITRTDQPPVPIGSLPPAPPAPADGVYPSLEDAIKGEGYVPRDQDPVREDPNYWIKQYRNVGEIYRNPRLGISEPQFPASFPSVVARDIFERRLAAQRQSSFDDDIERPIPPSSPPVPVGSLAPPSPRPVIVPDMPSIGTRRGPWQFGPPTREEIAPTPFIPPPAPMRDQPVPIGSLPLPPKLLQPPPPHDPNAIPYRRTPNDPAYPVQAFTRTPVFGPQQASTPADHSIGQRHLESVAGQERLREIERENQLNMLRQMGVPPQITNELTADLLADYAERTNPQRPDITIRRPPEPSFWDNPISGIQDAAGAVGDAALGVIDSGVQNVIAPAGEAVRGWFGIGNEPPATPPIQPGIIHHDNLFNTRDPNKPYQYRHPGYDDDISGGAGVDVLRGQAGNDGLVAPGDGLRNFAVTVPVRIPDGGSARDVFKPVPLDLTAELERAERPQSEEVPSSPPAEQAQDVVQWTGGTGQSRFMQRAPRALGGAVFGLPGAIAGAIFSRAISGSPVSPTPFMTTPRYEGQPAYGGTITGVSGPTPPGMPASSYLGSQNWNSPSFNPNSPASGGSTRPYFTDPNNRTGGYVAQTPSGQTIVHTYGI